MVPEAEKQRPFELGPTGQTHIINSSSSRKKCNPPLSSNRNISHQFDRREQIIKSKSEGKFRGNEKDTNLRVSVRVGQEQMSSHKNSIHNTYSFHTTTKSVCLLDSRAREREYVMRAGGQR